MRVKNLLLLCTCFSLLFFSSSLFCLENDECFDCHNDVEFTSEDRFGNEVSLHVEPEKFATSIHGDLSCVDCHEDATPDHDENLKKVNCASCHEDEWEMIKRSVHGEAALKRNDPLAPTCASCHGSHYILPPSDPESSTYQLNIPAMCGRCHKEGSEMTTTHDISQKNVVENYSMSIHGKGLLKMGLLVAPACTTCHGAHDILAHDNPDSKINEKNVSNNCMQCHVEIERVHKKVVEGRLWEEEPNKVPVCVECHPPHKVREVVYNRQITDDTCMECHAKKDLTMQKDGETLSLFVDTSELKGSIHGEIACVKCHYDMHPESDPVCKDSKPVDCSACHADEVAAYGTGIHGTLFAKDDPDAPSCIFCHGTHGTYSKKNSDSPTFPQNVPNLCARCHRDGERAAIRKTSSQTQILQNYSMSIHGKGLFQSGLLVTATCPQCHTPHQELPADDPRSTVHHNNITETCAKCHFGIYDQFKDSVHSPSVTKGDKKLPVCSNCHSAHTITRVDKDDFRMTIINECGGECHHKLTETYFETYHGKVSLLGGTRVAKCSDCHGAHQIKPMEDPLSVLHPDNRAETCKQCHPAANASFSNYLAHASYNDREKYPILFYSFWSMTLLLIAVFLFFGIHTILWLSRSLIDLRRGVTQKHKAEIEVPEEYKGRYVKRLPLTNRALHLCVVVSFLGLALTGLTLKFSHHTFFQRLSWLLGGPEFSGLIHRVCAIITFGYFAVHLYQLLKLFIRKEITVRGLFSEEYTMIPLWRDVVELKDHFLWFIGKGEKPKFGRWTYWEKFDYLAVFWGVAIIGITGLLLWFPELVTNVLPGWSINVATIIHGDEALLAVGFIFTIHFFNTHFRPDKFPMDFVIFTGRVSIEEFIEERPREYKQLKESGELERYLVDPPSESSKTFARFAGFTFLAIGLMAMFGILISLII